MRRLLGAAAHSAAIAAWSGPCLAAYEGSVDLFGGVKSLNADWEPADTQNQYGVELAFAPERSRVWFALDVLASSGTADSVDPANGPTHVHGSTVEYTIGVRKVWTRHIVRPQFGAGGAVVTAHLEKTSNMVSLDRKNNGVGLWVEAGCTFRIVEHFHLGIDARYSKADVDLGQDFDTLHVNAGGTQLGIVIGYDW